MSLIDAARDTIKNLPIADVLRERLSLALDQSADSERKIAELHTEKGNLNAQLEHERLNLQKAEDELHRLRELHAEEIRIVRATEFRRGLRTNGRWLPFCPRCHCPAGAR